MLTPRADGSPPRERRRRSISFVTTRVGLITGPAIVCLLLLAGCASDTTSDASASATTTQTPTAVSADGDVSGLIDIGNGRTVYRECRGTGSPTVVLISGLGGAGDQWQNSRPANDPTAEITENDQAVFQTAARSTRVCAYDRPNTMGAEPGRSTPVAQPTTSAVDAADLHALLLAAGVPGPYVLVGQSFGGLIATTYARTYPDDVVGLVLVDPLNQFLETTLGPAAWDRYVYVISTALPESKDLVVGNAALDNLPPIPVIPVVVLSSDQPWLKLPSDFATFEEVTAGKVPTVDSQKAWDEAQALLADSLGATHITQTNSGHEIEMENAPLVNQQICAVIGPATDC